VVEIQQSDKYILRGTINLVNEERGGRTHPGSFLATPPEAGGGGEDPIT
jgi:hypothetical protein